MEIAIFVGQLRHRHADRSWDVEELVAVVQAAVRGIQDTRLTFDLRTGVVIQLDWSCS